MKAVTVLFHTAATGIMAYGYLSLKHLPVDKFINTQKGGHSQFLTIIGCVQTHRGEDSPAHYRRSLWLACANMTLGLALDVLPTVTRMCINISRVSSSETSASCSFPEGEKARIDGCAASKCYTVAAHERLLTSW